MKKVLYLSIPMLKGCITVADTIEEGYKMIDDAKKEWLIAAIEEHITIPVPTDNYSG